MTEKVDPYLQYFLQFSEIKPLPHRLPDLHDGLFLSELLANINEFPAMKIQIIPSTFAHKFSNLKEVLHKIQQYWQNQLNRPFDSVDIDIIEMVHHHSLSQLKKLLEIVLKTCILSSKKESFVEKMLLTSSHTQQHFMHLIENTLNQPFLQSPHKQKRLYDKIIELDQQNQSLTEILHQLCDQKQELENKNSHLCQKIKLKEQEIQRLSYHETPEKRKRHEDHIYFDTNEKNIQYIEKLKKKLIDTVKHHESQIMKVKEENQVLRMRTQKVSLLENELEMCRVRLENADQAINKEMEQNKQISELKGKLLQKNQTIKQYSRKLQNKNQKIQELDEIIVELKLDLERKNVQMIELENSTACLKNNLEESFSFKPIFMNRTLSEQCPEVLNHHSEQIEEINKNLRIQLQRSVKTLKQTENQLNRLKKDLQTLPQLEQQNRKLTELLDQVSDQEYTEKTIILGAMHELRLRYMKDCGGQKEKNLKLQQLKKNFVKNVAMCSKFK